MSIPGSGGLRDVGERWKMKEEKEMGDGNEVDWKMWIGRCGLEDVESKSGR